MRFSSTSEVFCRCLRCTAHFDSASILICAREGEKCVIHPKIGSLGTENVLYEPKVTSACAVGVNELFQLGLVRKGPWTPLSMYCAMQSASIPDF